MFVFFLIDCEILSIVDVIHIVFLSVSSTDLERIETSFRDFTNGTGELSYTSFKRDVFANYLPEKLATVD